MNQKPIKQKNCRYCHKPFKPSKPLQSVCSVSCSIGWAALKRAKKEAQEATRKRVEHREAKERLKTKGDYAREAQIAINAYRREVTKYQGCISCGTHNGKMNGGHYRSVGSSPETRFVEENIWCQCERCNSYLSANLINYRINLIKRIGIDRVEWLEGPHSAKHYSAEELKTIKQTYKAKLAALK
jgi:hypothetical protein